MITRSNLAEQLREYQIRSKYDWASVSFLSSTANLTSSSSSKKHRVLLCTIFTVSCATLMYTIDLGGRCYLRHMGDPHSCFLGFFSNFFIFKVQAVGICLNMHYNPFACVLENNEASKTSSKKEAENATALVNVKPDASCSS
ncbi:NADH-ubiquinone oxidoreductase chain 5 [Cinnamomum micranthum f. kanehirae]|uniref:NADH-ubiquinone oxidoreductase chain 5 n=1 Tax=Cinnamomum micranthum f. kanehirae TaxID=337451 RepID=A0A3S3M930_9MAGN|nr:NADH-ubiquinone oxidoreductase chain 5 [Cinnamomum micranthum f. kanehirae]